MPLLGYVGLALVGLAFAAVRDPDLLTDPAWVVVAAVFAGVVAGVVMGYRWAWVVLLIIETFGLIGWLLFDPTVLVVAWHLSRIALLLSTPVRQHVRRPAARLE